MGFGKSFKKAWKKTVRAVTHPIEQAAKSTTKAITRGTESVVRRTGMEGTFLGDAINSFARTYTLPTQLVGDAAAIIGGESAKDVGKSLLVEGMRSTPTGESQYRKLEKAARQSAEAAAYQRKVDEDRKSVV